LKVFKPWWLTFKISNPSKLEIALGKHSINIDPP
jgi:hypothetical protein